MFRRLLIISSIVAALAGTAALAQGFRNRAAGRRDALNGRMLERLQQRLSLTEVQMNGIRALDENRRKEMELLRQEMQPKRQALRELLRQPNPNPNDVGNATLALRETRGRMRDINQRFLSGVKELLTPDQLQKLPKRFQ
jgi:Spy/CpxP family protein refolding chaperone